MAQIIAPCGVDPSKHEGLDYITEFSHPFEYVTTQEHSPGGEYGSRWDIRASAYYQKETFELGYDEKPDPVGPVVELHVHNLDEDGDIANQVINLDDMSDAECVELIAALQTALEKARRDAHARGWRVTS